MFGFQHHHNPGPSPLVGVSAARSPRPRQSLTHDLFWSVVYVAAITLLATVMAWQARDRHRYEKGQVISHPIVARVNFRAVDEVETLKKKADAKDREPGVYQPNDEYLLKVRERLDALFRLGADKSITSMQQIRPEDQRLYHLDPEGLALTELKRFNSDHPSPARWEPLIDQFMVELAGIAVLDPARCAIERDPAQRAPKIIIVHPTLDEIERYDNVLLSVRDKEVLRERIGSLLEKLHFPRPLWPCVLGVVLQNPQPTYLFNEGKTLQRQKEAYDREPVVERAFRANDLLIPAGKTLSEFDVKALEEEQRVYHAQLDAGECWLKLGGLAGIFALLTAALWIYLWAFHHRVIANPTRGLALTSLLLLGILVADSITSMHPPFLVAATTFPALLATIVLAIAYDQRLAVAAGSALTVLIMVSLHLTLDSGLILLAGVITAAALLNEVRTRSKLVLVGLWAGIGMAAMTLLVGLVDRTLTLPDQFKIIRDETILALGTGLFTGLFVQGILPAIEKIFKVTTAMTLKELNDASHPLLRRLAQEAPGTYQHSLRLSDLAEEAANAIGANALICKVGAMYHDIGKISKPAYFVENQGNGPNQHQQLQPVQSLNIILDHVRDGRELARQHNLPAMIRHLIESHHGTTLVEYFYHAAQQCSQEQGIAPPPENSYRYPGPKPQSREAAILMLCDSIESAARTLPDPTPAKLEQLVHHLVSKRFTDGQLDDSTMTLHDLHGVETAIAKTLSAMYHGRIAYPADQSRAVAPV